MNSSTSIFRTKGEEYPKQRYEQSLHQRYHLTEERISWDVEENPPVESTGSNVTNILKRENGGHSKDGKGSLHVIAEDENGGKQTGQSESNSSTDAQKMKYR